MQQTEKMSLVIWEGYTKSLETSSSLLLINSEFQDVGSLSRLCLLLIHPRHTNHLVSSHQGKIPMMLSWNYTSLRFYSLLYMYPDSSWRRLQRNADVFVPSQKAFAKYLGCSLNRMIGFRWLSLYSKYAIEYGLSCQSYPQTCRKYR